MRPITILILGSLFTLIAGAIEVQKSSSQILGDKGLGETTRSGNCPCRTDVVEKRLDGNFGVPGTGPQGVGAAVGS